MLGKIKNSAKAYWPIGCDLSHDEIRLVQMEPGRNGPTRRCEATAHLAEFDPAADLMTSTALVDAVAKAIESADFQGRDLVLAMPSTSLQYRQLQMAPMPAPELRSAARWQFARELNLEAEQVVGDSVTVGRTMSAEKARLELVAFGCEVDRIVKWVTLFENRGLRPVAIDIAAAAMARYAEHQLALSQQPSHDFLIIDMDNTATGIVLVADGQIRFTRAIKTDKNFVISELARALSVEPVDAASVLDHANGVGPWTLPDRQPEDATSALAQAERIAMQHLVREISLCLQHVKRLDRAVNPTRLLVRESYLSRDAVRSAAHSMGLELSPWARIDPDSSADGESGRHSTARGTGAVANGLALYGPLASVTTKEVA